MRETQSTCFLFLLENPVTRKGKQLVNFDYQCKFSLLAPSLRQQRALVIIIIIIIIIIITLFILVKDQSVSQSTKVDRLVLIGDQHTKYI